MGGIVLVIVAGGLYAMSTQSPSSSAPITNSEAAPTQAATTTPTQENTMNEQNPTAPAAAMDVNAATAATLHTSMGDVTVKFYKSDAPKTVENFLKLASTGFYDNTKFHRVIKGFMIQGGDPISKDDTMASRWGTGGPGYQFADEINSTSAVYQKGYKHGIVAMANSGPNTNGSQFFIMAADYPLPPLYTIFGEVTDGLSVVDAIDATPTGASDRPVTGVVIKSVDLK